MVTNEGKLIKAALARLGRTQRWLADQLDVSDNAVSKWLRTGQISRANAGAISVLLGIPADKLLPTGIHETSSDERNFTLKDIQTSYLPKHTQVFDVISDVANLPQIFDGDALMAANGNPVQRFAWLAEDDHMSEGPLPIQRGYYVIIEPQAQHEMGDVVLVRISNGRPVLRQITHGGDAPYLVTSNSGLPAIRISDDCNIIGVALTAFPKPISRKLRSG